MRRAHAWFVLTGIALLVSACDDEIVAPPLTEDGGGGTSTGSSMGSGATPNMLSEAQLGNPELRSAQQLAFGPGGVLLIGDGRTDRLVAVETGDTSLASREENAFERIDNLAGAAANAIGKNVTASELQIDDMAVNPVSHRTYLAVTRFTTLEAYVLSVGPDGDLHVFDLDNVVHAIVDVPPADGGAATFAGLSWTDENVIGSVTPQSFLRHELTYVKTPFAHEGRVRYATTRVFHKGWGMWVDNLPMDRFFTYEDGGELFVAGSFGSSVARFRSAELEGGAADVQGATVFDLLDGRTVSDFMTYERDGETLVIVSVVNFIFDGNAAGLRLTSEIFSQSEAIDEQAPLLVDFTGAPLVAGVERAPAFDLARKMDRRGDQHAVVMRANSLVAVELP